MENTPHRTSIAITLSKTIRKWIPEADSITCTLISSEVFAKDSYFSKMFVYEIIVDGAAWRSDTFTDEKDIEIYAIFLCQEVLNAHR